MIFSEGHEHHSPRDGENDDVVRAEASLDRAARQAAYSAARLQTMEGLLREQSRLEVEDRLASERLARAEQLAQLADRLDQARDRAGGHAGGRSPSDEVVKARQVLTELQTTKQSSVAALTAIRESIAAQDTALKARYRID